MKRHICKDHFNVDRKTHEPYCTKCGKVLIWQELNIAKRYDSSTFLKTTEPYFRTPQEHKGKLKPNF